MRTPLPNHSLVLTALPSGEIMCRARLNTGRPGDPSANEWRQVKRTGCAPLSIAVKSAQREVIRSGHGKLPRKTSFTRHARRKLKALVGAVHQEYQKRVLFGTLTLPGRSPASQEAIARFSAKLIESLMKWVCRIAPGTLWAYVWERHQSGTLHLHLVLANRNHLALRNLEKGYKQYVYELYMRLSRSTGIDWFGREDGGTWKDSPEYLRNHLVPVRKSVVRYLAKYVSKGHQEDGIYYPASWSGACQDLRRLAATLTRSAVMLSTNGAYVLRAFSTIRALASASESRLYEYAVRYSTHHMVLLIYPPSERYVLDFQTMVSYLQQNVPGAVA
jgi:hypothetical protein